ncbi:hypothetical protein Vretifemale_17272 [Volvox reticuliferus]|uniref:EF-hand domain-containing protein n=1 Tax=Volvox reticuliferus TaxID=1737510 RepID=A0A8J4CTE1_9CHLO|nr:hypothetical protein Vretifemale_17272 [Volvox reticuliferus]
MSTVDPTVARLWFESVDADSSGLLDAKELRQALDIGGLDYTLAQAHLFVRTFDSTGNQKLNVNEFVELHLFLETVQSSFSRVARGGRWLSTADVKQALNLMGHSLSDTAMQAVLSRSPWLPYDIFLRAYRPSFLFLIASVWILGKRKADRSGLCERTQERLGD